MDRLHRGAVVKARLLVASAVLVAAVAASLVGVGSAEARGYTCIYRSTDLPTVTIAIDGYDNFPGFCRSLNSGLNGRRVASAPGGVYCAWKMRGLDVRINAHSRSASIGRLFCTLMKGNFPSKFKQIR